MSDSSIGSISNSGSRIFLGGSSGLDTGALVESLVQVRRIPIDRLEIKVEENNLQIEAMKTMQDQLQAMRDVLLPLRSPLASESAFSVRSTLIGGGDGNGAQYFGITATNTANVDAYNIQIGQVAREKISTVDITDGAQTLTFGNTGVADFTVGLVGGESLTDIAAAINTAAGNDDGSGARVLTASVVEVSEGVFDLVLRGNDAQDFTATSTIGLSESVNQTAQSAVVTVNGIQITRDNNEIDLGAAGLAPGVTLTLFQEPPPGQTYTGEVIADRSAAQQAIGAFVEQLNEFFTFYSDQTARGPNGRPLETAVLANDGNLRSVRNRVLEDLFASVDVGGGRNRNLASLGISLNGSGQLEIDAAKLSQALNADISTSDNDITFTEVGTLFQSIGAQLNTLARDFADGTVATTIEQTQIANNGLNERITGLTNRLEDYRIQLIEKFAKMDQAIAQAEAIRNQLRTMTESLANG